MAFASVRPWHCFGSQWHESAMFAPARTCLDSAAMALRSLSSCCAASAPVTVGLRWRLWLAATSAGSPPCVYHWWNARQLSLRLSPLPMRNGLP